MEAQMSLQEAARLEAERRYARAPLMPDINRELDMKRVAFLLGAAWAEQEAAARERDLEQALTNICEYAMRHEDTNEVASTILLMADMALVRNPGPVVVGVPPEPESTGQE